MWVGNVAFNSRQMLLLDIAVAKGLPRLLIHRPGKQQHYRRFWRQPAVSQFHWTSGALRVAKPQTRK